MNCSKFSFSNPVFHRTFQHGWNYAAADGFWANS